MGLLEKQEGKRADVSIDARPTLSSLLPPRRSNQPTRSRRSLFSTGSREALLRLSAKSALNADLFSFNLAALHPSQGEQTLDLRHHPSSSNALRPSGSLSSPRNRRSWTRGESSYSHLLLKTTRCQRSNDLIGSLAVSDNNRRKLRKLEQPFPSW